MSVRISDDMSVAALQLFEQAAEDLLDGEMRDAIKATVYTGINAFKLRIPHSRIVPILEEILTAEVLRGYMALARRWLEQFELENGREDTLSMIYIVLGSTIYLEGGLPELARYIETYDRYPQLANDQVDAPQSSSDFCYSLAWILEAIWVTRACELTGQEVPSGTGPEAEQFSACVASIICAMQEKIEKCQQY